MNALTFRQLRYLDALARHGHFGRAADACAVSQPALSNQIRELETQLGTRLVERTSRQVSLTPVGSQVVERARAILASVDEMVDLARSDGQSIASHLRLGIIPTVAPYLLPAISQNLGHTYPGSDLRPREALTQTLVDDLLAYRLDAAIVALPLGDPTLHEEPLFEEEFVLVRHKDEAEDPVPTATSLRRMRLLLLEEGHCLRDQALSFCDLGGQKPRDVLEGSSLSTLVQMVGVGIGLTLIPEIALPLESRTSSICVSRFSDDVPSRTLGMIWRRKSPFFDELREISGIIKSLGLAAVDRARAM